MRPSVLLSVAMWWSASAGSLDDFACDAMRNDTGFAAQRRLHVPSSMWQAAGAEDLAWAQKLCCLYTAVALDNSTSIAFMVTYDGGRRNYEDQSTVAEVAEGAYAAVCGMAMGRSDCATASARCSPSTLEPRRGHRGGSGTWAQGVPEGPGDSCNSSLQSALRYGCSEMLDTAQHICCHNTRYAEPRWYFQSAGGPGGLFSQLDPSGVTTFYDSACGIPLYRAPVGRSLEDWLAESTEHGWPSFRRQETFLENMVFRADGEMQSVCGTHLGHNLPDATGDRFCIDLVCIAGSPVTQNPAMPVVQNLAMLATSELAAGPHASVAVLAVAAMVAVMLGTSLRRRRQMRLQDPLLPAV